MKDDAKTRPIKELCLRNCLRASYSGFALFPQPSVEAAEFFGDWSLALVFIDGSHDYVSVKADLAAWTRKVRPGGLIAGHDWGCSGVTDAVREAFGDKVVERLPASWEVRL